MSSVLEPKTQMTEEEFLALPDDGVRRWFIDGEVWIMDGGMTTRSWKHSEIMITVGFYLLQWLKTQPLPRGKIVGGEAGFRIQANPKQVVGIDVAYIDPELAASLTESQKIIPGVPTLAVEILSTSDSPERVNEKIEVYREAGVKLLWIIDPHLRTITVLEQGKAPIMFNHEQTITAEPYLPGFAASVEKIFG